MGFTNKTAATGLAALAAVLAALAAPAALATGERLAAFYKNQVDPHFALVRAGVEQAAKDMGAGAITHYAPTRPNNLAEQLSQIEDVTVKHPDAILFMAVDARGVVPAIEKVNAAGIPIVNYNDRVRGGKFVSYVAADDYNLGLDAGRYLLKALGGKGNVIILEGVKGSTTSDDRVRGFRKALEENPGVKMIASQPANYQRLQALQVTENLLQSNPQIDGVMAAADVMAFGAVEAPQAAGKKETKVVGIGGVPESIQAIKDGRLLATAEFNGYKMGCLATMAALRQLRGQPVPPEIVIKGIVIDKSTMAPFEVPPEKRQCPKWDEYVK